MRRSMLFLPGNAPKMIINGNYLGSDAVIFDLEDAVAPDQKDAARRPQKAVEKTCAQPHEGAESPRKGGRTAGGGSRSHNQLHWMIFCAIITKKS